MGAPRERVMRGARLNKSPLKRPLVVLRGGQLKGGQASRGCVAPARHCCVIVIRPRDALCVRVYVCVFSGVYMCICVFSGACVCVCVCVCLCVFLV